MGVALKELLVEELARGHVVGLAGPVEEIAVEHLLALAVGPETLDQDNTGLHAALRRLDVRKVASSVGLLVETHRAAVVFQRAVVYYVAVLRERFGFYNVCSMTMIK